MAALPHNVWDMGWTCYSVQRWLVVFSTSRACHLESHVVCVPSTQMSLHGMHVSEGSFLALVDQDGDGLLSFGEYMFFLTLLAGAYLAHVLPHTACGCVSWFCVPRS